MPDEFHTYLQGLDSPAARAVAVTPDDDADLADSARALYVGGGGDVEVIPVGQAAAVTFTAVPAGSVLPVRVARVRAAGTTATGIVALS